MGVIDAGRVIEVGPPQELINKHCEQYFMVNGVRYGELNGLTTKQVRVHQGSLEEVFLKLTGKSIYIDENRN